jgi:microcystin degradation protein MlrC
MNEIRRPLRFFVAGLMHETNSFSPLPTSMRSFEADLAYIPPSLVMREEALAFAGYGDAIRVIRARGDEAIEGPCFWTQPSGPSPAPLWARLRAHVLDALAKAAQIDAVLLVLHGAMSAGGTIDCEGELLQAVRDLVGHHMPVGAVLDLHGNVGLDMIGSGAILVGVKEYPHIDYPERVSELHDMLSDMVRGAPLMMSLRTIPVLSLQGTTEEPMRGFVDRMIATEGRNDIRSLTLMHGFPWSDWSEAGASVLVVSENADPTGIDAVADDLAEGFLDIVNGSPVQRMSVAEAVSAALDTDPGTGPVVIADSSDNPGGGAACDSTYLLRELINRGCRNVALGMIWDPQAAQIAADAGVGANLPLRIGGKVGPLSGDPVDLECEVIAVRDDARQAMFSSEPNAPLGLTVGLRAGGIELVINSIRQQVLDTRCFTEVGIDPASKSIVVVKSSQHFRALFDPIARATIYCNAPGSLNLDLAQMPYRHLTLSSANASFAIERPVTRARGPITKSST